MDDARETPYVACVFMTIFSCFWRDSGDVDPSIGFVTPDYVYSNIWGKIKNQKIKNTKNQNFGNSVCFFSFCFV